jgi:hypothetical protein
MGEADRVRHHRLASRSGDALGNPPGIPRLLDALCCQDGLVRAFFGAGTAPAALAATAPEGCAQPVELRPVSGALMAVLAGEGPVALADGGRLDLVPDQAGPDFLAGLNCLLAFRTEETPLQVAEWLIYHALNHEAQGAVIVNRLPGDFARALAAAIADTALRVMVLDVPLAIGKPGVPPENGLHLAPDAPGRARMAVPAADPWRSPPGEPLIHEICKWRALAQARAVLNLDVTDYLSPRARGEAPAFDLARASKTGVILLLGRHIYPWRVRPQQQGARIGDHICRPFDKGHEIARWGAAPDRAGLKNTWRGVRVSYASPDRSVSARFDRAMAIRVPGPSASQLAPRAALVEDPALVALAQTLMGWDPIRPPRALPRQDSPGTGGRVAIVTTMRNIALYRKLGVHRPKGLNPEHWTRIRWLNGSGQPMPREMFRNGWRSTTETYGNDWVQLNHYAVRSAESFLVKRDRGRVNHVDRDQGLAYWFRMNHNIDQDHTIAGRLPMLRAELQRLMADPEIAAAHGAAVAAHKARIKILRADPAMAAFHAELTGERMRTLCRMQRHFGSGVFREGPQVIPDDLLTRDLDPDFFFTLGGEEATDAAT